MEKIICDHYHITRKVGSGSFGLIYEAVDSKSNKIYAIKLESPNKTLPSLSDEHKTLRILDGATGFAKSYKYTIENNYHVLIMDLLGQNLGELFNNCGKIFTIKTVLMLADQMLARLHYIHKKCLLHKDIKPENFLIGLNRNDNVIHLIDFGLSWRYCDPNTKIHIPMRDGKCPIGTLRYESINTQKGIEMSRRDDLESLAYVLIYFLKGRLPWQGMPKTPDRAMKTCQMKELLTAEELCEGLPSEFATFLSNVKSLQFDEKPHYNQYRRMFRELFINEGYVYDNQFDWKVTTIPIPQGLPALVPNCRMRNTYEMLFRKKQNKSKPLQLGNAHNMPKSMLLQIHDQQKSHSMFPSRSASVFH